MSVKDVAGVAVRRMAKKTDFMVVVVVGMVELVMMSSDGRALCVPGWASNNCILSQEGVSGLLQFNFLLTCCVIGYSLLHHWLYKLYCEGKE